MILYHSTIANGASRRLLLDNFQGKLTSTKYAKLSKCSQDTAHRDILNLVALGVLLQNPEGGRSTGYSLVGWP